VPDPTTPVLEAQQRCWSYWFIDGLPSLVAGPSCLIMALFLLAAQLRPTRPLTITFAIAALLLYPLMLFRMKQVIEWLKVRITYPRTGYTAPPYFVDDRDTLVVFPVAVPSRLAVFLVGGGIVLVGSGAFRLFRYIRGNPIAKP
jgi:ABC-type cobalamin transport system permease subunit